MVLTLGILAACQEATSRSEGTAAIVSSETLTTVIDSVFPVEEEIRRFKAARNGVSATALTGGAPSRDDLVRRFIRAVEASDTIQLRQMVINAGEFIDLYYPASMFSKPPYKQSPELRWFLMQENSNKGITRLLQRYGGKRLRVSAYQCAARPTIEENNKLWDRCTVTWNQQPSQMRVFSTIIERDGQFKIVSYANDL